MRILSLLLSFRGRINRSMFWLGHLLSVVLVIALLGLGYAIGAAIVEDKAPDLFAGVWVSAAVLLYVWMFLALCTKRFHDHDSSAWWCLILAIPAIGLLFFLIELGMFRGTKGGNRYGADPAG